MRPTQYFTDEYLEQCRMATPTQILTYLENYRLLHSAEDKSKQISIKIPESLLSVFRQKCSLHDVKYQTQIKRLMQEWIS